MMKVFSLPIQAFVLSIFLTTSALADYTKYKTFDSATGSLTKQAELVAKPSSVKPQLDLKLSPKRFTLSIMHERGVHGRGAAISSEITIRYDLERETGTIREKRYFGTSELPFVFNSALNRNEVLAINQLTTSLSQVRTSKETESEFQDTFRLSLRNETFTIIRNFESTKKKGAQGAGLAFNERLTQKFLTDLYQRLAAKGDRFSELNRRYSQYDKDRNGTLEIVELVSLEQTRIDPNGAPLVLVLVDPRLIADESDPIGIRPITETLERYSLDLTNEGYQAKLVSAQVYNGTEHQDGLTLLALRSYLKAVQQSFPTLDGVVLVGRFPDALLVRRFTWWRDSDTISGVSYNSGQFYRSVPEIIADKADIVLADLDGNWEQTYYRARTPISSFKGKLTGRTRENVFDLMFEVSPFDYRDVHYEDFFFINDSEVVLDCAACATTFFQPTGGASSPEASFSDRRNPNQLARPEIKVSRIDASHIAVSPDPAIGLLDAQGQPQRVDNAAAAGVRNPDEVWVHDFDLERELITLFFDRNHGYRSGDYEIKGAASVSSPSFPLGAERRAELDSVSGGNLSVSDDADIGQYASWFDWAAEIRHIEAHSYSGGSMFGEQTWDELSTQWFGPGRRPFAWRWEDPAVMRNLVPTLEGFLQPDNNNEVKATFHLYRTQWENYRKQFIGRDDVLPQIAFYTHSGCQVVSPAGASWLRYNDQAYGKHQGAESILFYGNGLVLLGRSKVFNDFPKNFYGSLEKKASYGDAWAAYFEHDSRLWIDEHANSSVYGNETVVTSNVRAKKAYPWNLIGDYTLKLN